MLTEGRSEVGRVGMARQTFKERRAAREAEEAARRRQNLQNLAKKHALEAPEVDAAYAEALERRNSSAEAGVPTSESTADFFTVPGMRHAPVPTPAATHGRQNFSAAVPDGKCPKCGGTQFTAKRSKKGKGVGIAIGAVTLGLGAVAVGLAPKSQVKCVTCGTMYKRG